MGLIVGAGIGPLALIGALVALRLSRGIRGHGHARRALVAGVSALITTGSVAFVFLQIHAPDPVLYLLVICAVSAAITFGAYPTLRECLAEAPDGSPGGAVAG